MKIIKNEKSEFGDFKIYESDGKQISKIFIDFETKLLIVKEKFIDLDAYAGFSYKFTTINPKTGKTIGIRLKLERF